jgi:fructokinase
MIVVCGEALIDMVPQGDRFYPAPGGSPYNTAVTAARLDVNVRFFGQLLEYPFFNEKNF